MASPGNPHCANCIGTLSFPIITARCYASVVTAMACVRPSVCLSVVTSRSSTKTAKRRITQTTPHDSPETIVF